jgi:transposase
MLRAVVHPASVQDRDGLARVLDRRTRRRFPFIDVVFADQGYQGPKAAAVAARTGTWKLEIVRRDPGQKGFAVLPMRWVVERTLSWIRRNRRLAKDVEHLARSAEALISLAMIKLMLTRISHQG